MLSLHSPIVLIGFKHTGKSVVGKNLANALHVPFSDLDQHMECLYQNTYHANHTCREIMQKNGEHFFRELEAQALSEVVNRNPSVISLGGGAPLQVENQNKIKPCIVIHLTAPKEIVYARICESGLPAFFKQDADPLDVFNRLWDEREVIYRRIKHITIENNGTIQET